MSERLIPDSSVDVSDLAVPVDAVPENHSSIPSVTCECIGVSRRGPEQYYNIRRKALHPWFVARTEGNRIVANFQGNPLWPSLCFRDFPNTRTFFGLSEYDAENICTIPHIHTLNKRIVSLMRRAGLSAYTFEQANMREESLSVSLENYVDSFIDKKVMPFGVPGTIDFFHDWSYHFLSCLFPVYLDNLRQVLNHIRSRLLISEKKGMIVTRPWNYFGYSLTSSAGYVQDFREESLSYKVHIYRQMSAAIDVVTGRIVQIVVGIINGHGNRLNNELQAFSIFMEPMSNHAINRVLFQEEDVDLYKLSSAKIHNSSKSAKSAAEYIIFNLAYIDKLCREIAC